MEPMSIVLLCLAIAMNVVCFSIGVLIGRNNAYEHIEPYNLAEGADPRKFRSRPDRTKSPPHA